MVVLPCTQWFTVPTALSPSATSTSMRLAWFQRMRLSGFEYQSHTTAGGAGISKTRVRTASSPTTTIVRASSSRQQRSRSSNWAGTSPRSSACWREGTSPNRSQSRPAAATSWSVSRAYPRSPVVAVTVFFSRRWTMITSGPANSFLPTTVCSMNSPWWPTNLRSSDGS